MEKRFSCIISLPSYSLVGEAIYFFRNFWETHPDAEEALKT